MSSTTSDDKTFCFKTLLHVSRSFGVVIEQLDDPLRTTVCVFYLLLRALDTIEDESTMIESIKLKALEMFPTYLDDTHTPVVIGLDLSFNGNKNYIELIENFDKVLRVFCQCTIADKKIIRDVVHEMSRGMIKYSNHPIETCAEYNEYSYYVAGLVGVGLTKLIQSNCVLDRVRVSDIDLQRLAISTGTFLQKTNIIRDIYEDINHPTERIFYPKEIWGKYVKNVRHLIDESYQPQAIACLNDLINDAFQHLPHSVQYLSLVSRTNTFRFTAIPQCMAVATLETMFNNPAVFNSSVKINKTESGSIIENVSDMTSCLNVMKSYLSKLSTKVNSSNHFAETKNWILEGAEFVNNYRH